MASVFREAAGPLSLLAALVAVLTFGFTYVTGHTALIALGIVGYIYVVIGGVVINVIAIIEERKRGWELVLYVAAALFILVVFLMLLSDRFTTFVSPHFRFAQGVGTFIILLLLFIGGFELYERGRDRKKCPECAETVLLSARVCRYCGFRWMPPLAGDAERGG